jgi:hypothetical protein
MKKNEVFVDKSANMHPYECDGNGHCIHCDRKKTEAHDPESCALCQDGRNV